MSNKYRKISKGICPECESKMHSSDHTKNNGFDWYCDRCSVRYHFNDDPGPGAYSIVKLAMAFLDVLF